MEHYGYTPQEPNKGQVQAKPNKFPGFPKNFSRQGQNLGITPQEASRVTLWNGYPLHNK